MSLPDQYWMEQALSLARTAYLHDEVPVGAIVVRHGRIIATGWNRREYQRQATAHAEILALEEASRQLGNWRLVDCELFVTLEPCLMCAGAIYQARIARVVFGASDPKFGALGSLYQIQDDQRLNHRFPATGGLLEAECAALLQSFFRKKRQVKSPSLDPAKQSN